MIEEGKLEGLPIHKRNTEHVFVNTSIKYIPKQMHIHILFKDKCFCSKTTLQIDREWIKKDDVYIQNPAYERKVQSKEDIFQPAYIDVPINQASNV